MCVCFHLTYTFKHKAVSRVREPAVFPTGTRARKERKVQGFFVQLKADKISLGYHTNQRKKSKRKEKPMSNLSPEMVVKSASYVRKGEGDYGRNDYGKGIV